MSEQENNREEIRHICPSNATLNSPNISSGLSLYICYRLESTSTCDAPLMFKEASVEDEWTKQQKLKLAPRADMLTTQDTIS